VDVLAVLFNVFGIYFKLFFFVVLCFCVVVLYFNETLIVNERLLCTDTHAALIPLVSLLIVRRPADGKQHDHCTGFSGVLETQVKPTAVT